MDIAALKEKLGDETFSKLQDHIDSLEAKADTAARGSSAQSKGLKAKVAELQELVDRAFEKLGVSSPEELDGLPDAKGQGEAVKQMEARVKKAERERAEAVQRADDAVARIRTMQKEAAIAKAAAKHEFIDPEVAGALIERRLRWESEELMFEADGGKLISVAEGAAWLAKSKPSLVKAQGGAGSGYRDGGNGSNGVKNPFAKDSFNLTEQIQLRATNPQLAEQMAAAAAN